MRPALRTLRNAETPTPQGGQTPHHTLAPPPFQRAAEPSERRIGSSPRGVVPETRNAGYFSCPLKG